jgi:hypothetical protein
MAKARPFTYNPSSPIEGNAQIGNLAYGALNPTNSGPNYSGNPGGRKWWMGPDEDLDKYYIGKDVPTMDHPTPVPEGDIGSVRFWSSAKNDSAFIARVNDLPARVGQTPFTTVFECLTWFIDNGYWTNYPTSNTSYQFPYDAQIKFVQVPSTGSDGVDYTWDEPLLPIRTRASQIREWKGNSKNFYISDNSAIYFLDFSSVSGDELFITSSEYGGEFISDWGPPDPRGQSEYSTWWISGSIDDSSWLENYNNRRYNGISIDSNSNRLYTMGLSNSSKGWFNTLYKWNLNTLRVIDYAYQNDFTDVILQGNISYDSVNDKIFIGGTRPNLSNFPNDYILAITGSDFTKYEKLTDSGINSPTNINLPTTLTTGNTSTISMLTSGGSTTSTLKYAFINNSTLSVTVKSASVPSSTRSWINTFGSQRPGYNPEEDKFYVSFRVGYGSSARIRVLVIDGSTGDPIKNIICQTASGPYNFGTVNILTDLIYDSNRNAIWGINLNKKIFAIDCSNDSLWGEFGFEDSSIDPLGENQNWEVSTTLSIDSTNDILIHGVSATTSDVISTLQNVWYTYPLNNFWPI